MPPDPFAEELVELIQSGLPFEEMQVAVGELFHKHGREVPPPVTGSIALKEPEDRFGG
jgi:hypothetical protein